MQRLPLTRCNSHFSASNVRKFAEQHGGIIDGINQAEHTSKRMECRALNGLITGICCLSTFFDVYMRYWKDVKLANVILEGHQLRCSGN